MIKNRLCMRALMLGLMLAACGVTLEGVVVRVHCSIVNGTERTLLLRQKQGLYQSFVYPGEELENFFEAALYFSTSPSLLDWEINILDRENNSQIRVIGSLIIPKRDESALVLNCKIHDERNSGGVLCVKDFELQKITREINIAIRITLAGEDLAASTIEIDATPISSPRSSRCSLM